MPKLKSHKRKTKGSKISLLADKDLPNIDDIVTEVESLIDSFNYDEAVQKLKVVLNIDSNHVKASEMLAGVYIEQGEFEKAHDLLQKCIEVLPNEGFSKYFSMGQLCGGVESIKYYRKGIEILEKQLENCENVVPEKGPNKKSLVRILSDAYCSISEIFMTDCCFSDGAEESCLTAIEAGIAVDPSNPEAYKCKADFKLVKEEVDDAKEAMQKSLSLWLPQHEDLRDGEISSSDLEIAIPSYDSRIQTSKLLIELSMYDEATKILDGLVEEDDEVVEVWYLLGWMNYIQGEEYKLNAHYYLDRAKQVIAKTGAEGEDYIEHIRELVEELQEAYPLDLEVEAEQELNSDLSGDSEEEMET